MIQKDSYTSAQLTAMVVLRLFIGWHFAYEGLVKILNPKWTSLPYLLDSKGFMSDFFAGLASDPAMMNMVNEITDSDICTGYLSGYSFAEFPGKREYLLYNKTPARKNSYSYI